MFDEANASGLLLNNIQIRSDVMVCLDPEMPSESNQLLQKSNQYQKILRNKVKENFKESLLE